MFPKNPRIPNTGPSTIHRCPSQMCKVVTHQPQASQLPPSSFPRPLHSSILPSLSPSSSLPSITSRSPYLPPRLTSLPPSLPLNLAGSQQTHPSCLHQPVCCTLTPPKPAAPTLHLALHRGLQTIFTTPGEQALGCPHLRTGIPTVQGFPTGWLFSP